MCKCRDHRRLARARAAHERRAEAHVQRRVELHDLAHEGGRLLQPAEPQRMVERIDQRARARRVDGAHPARQVRLLRRERVDGQLGGARGHAGPLLREEEVAAPGPLPAVLDLAVQLGNVEGEEVHDEAVEEEDVLADELGDVGVRERAHDDVVLRDDERVDAAGGGDAPHAAAPAAALVYRHVRLALERAGEQEDGLERAHAPVVVLLPRELLGAERVELRSVRVASGSESRCHLPTVRFLLLTWTILSASTLASSKPSASNVTSAMRVTSAAIIVQGRKSTLRLSGSSVRPA